MNAKADLSFDGATCQLVPFAGFRLKYSCYIKTLLSTDLFEDVADTGRIASSVV